MTGISIKSEATGFKRSGTAPKITLKVYEDGGVRYGGKVIVTEEGLHLSFQNGADLSYPDFALLAQAIADAEQEVKGEILRRSGKI